MAKCFMCGAEVPDGERICSTCGTAIETWPMESQDSRLEREALVNGEGSSFPTLVLQDLRDQTEILVEPPGGIIGRSGDFSPEHFSLRVSRTQLKLSPDVCNQSWQAEYIGRADTFVSSGRSSLQMQPHDLCPLFGGETLRIGDMVFKVELRQVPGAVPTQEEPVDDTLQGWVITCPVCSSQYLVDNEHSRIDECETCRMPKSKKRIAEQSPHLKSYRHTDDLMDRRASHVD